MGDTLQVSLDTSKDVQQPSLEDEAAKYEEPSPVVEDRPEWLPEKFKSVEDMAKAYSELERKLGSGRGLEATEKAQDGDGKDSGTEVPDDQNADSEAPNEADDPAREAAENAGLNFDSLSEKYWEKGGLDESDYKALEKSGIPKAIVDQYIAGQEALLNATKQSVFSEVGGEASYYEMTEWAGDTLTKAEIDAFNRAVNSGDMNMTMMAVKGLQARYRAEVGFEPSRQVRGENTNASATVYRSLAELQKDMSDPRYAKDPAFRKDVERKLERSDIM